MTGNESSTRGSAARLLIFLVVVALVLLLSGCPTWFSFGGSNDDPGDTTQDDGSSSENGTGDGSSAGNGSSSPSPLPRMTLILDYLGTQTIDAGFPIYVEVERTDATAPLLEREVAVPEGTEAFERLVEGTYTITVYIDELANGSADPVSEPSLSIDNVTVTADTDDSLHFILDDLDIPTDVTVEAYVTYTGAETVDETSPIALKWYTVAVGPPDARLEAPRGAVILPDVDKTSHFVDFFVDVNDNGDWDGGEPISPEFQADYATAAGVVIETITISD
jgi:hypothetical protein